MKIISANLWVTLSNLIGNYQCGFQKRKSITDEIPPERKRNSGKIIKDILSILIFSEAL